MANYGNTATPGKPPSRENGRWKRWLTSKIAFGIYGFILGASVGSCGAGGTANTSTAPAPTPTVTAVTAPTQTQAPVTTSTPQPTQKAATTAPATTTEAKKESLAVRVQEIVDTAEWDGVKVGWAMSITKVEDYTPGTVKVYYQETFASKEEAEAAGHPIMTYVTLYDKQVDEELHTIILVDASGREYNIYNL